MTKQEKNAMLERQAALLQDASKDAACLPHTSTLAELTEALIDCLNAIDENA